MADRTDESIIAELSKRLLEDSTIGRYQVCDEYSISEWHARELLRKARNQPRGGLTMAYFDIETTSLKPDFGHLLCASVLSYPDMEMRTFRVDEYGDPEVPYDDSALAVKIRDYLERFHMVGTWYGKAFDVPFLNTRLMAAGERGIASQFHVDFIWYYKGWRGVKTTGSKLETVAEFYKLGERKMKLDREVFAQAAYWNTPNGKRQLDTIVERCESDVRLTCEVGARTFDQGLVKNIQRYP